MILKGAVQRYGLYALAAALVLALAWVTVLNVQNANLRETIAEDAVKVAKWKQEAAEELAQKEIQQREAIDAALAEEAAKRKILEARTRGLLAKLKEVQGYADSLSDFVVQYLNGVYDRAASEFGGAVPTPPEAPADRPRPASRAAEGAGPG